MLNQANTSQNSNSVGGHMAFLRRVTEDDRFRAALEADPQAALAEFGLSVEAGQIPSAVTIPGVESIQHFLLDDGQTDTDAIGPERWAGFFGS